jgi:hypothetical protein
MRINTNRSVIYYALVTCQYAFSYYQIMILDKLTNFTTFTNHVMHPLYRILSVNLAINAKHT